jgi:hypothetical protein
LGTLQDPAFATVTFTQITNQLCFASMPTPSINNDGSRFVLACDADLTPGAPGNPDSITQVYLWIRGTGLTQLTSAAQFSYPAVISADGTHIVFMSAADLTPGAPGNPNHNAQLFLWSETGGFTQLTNLSTARAFFANSNVSINANGTRVAFASIGDVTPGAPGNADGNSELFLWTQATGLTQLTNTPTSSTFISTYQPSINADGTRIAFISNADLTPNAPGNPNHTDELFHWTQGVGFTQLTTGGAGSPSLNADGTRIAFHSRADLTPGAPGNADHNTELFLWTENVGFTQITNTTNIASPSTTIASGEASLNADGTRIAFLSLADLTPGAPGNADYNQELFLWTQDTGFAQLTNTSSTLSFFINTFTPSISGDGHSIAFISTADLTPGNPGNRLAESRYFLADISTSTSTLPVLSVSPSSLDFGPVPVNTSKDLTLTVTNTGGSTLTGSATTTAPFNLPSGAAFSLTAGQSQDITVRFSPTSAGTFVSNVTFTSNGGTASPVVRGTGAVPHIDSVSPAFNSVGAVVLVNGSLFGATQGSSTIRVCTVAPQVRHWDAAAIAIVVPTLPVGTACQVQVTTSAGPSNTVTLTVIAPATISGFVRDPLGRGIRRASVAINPTAPSVVTTQSSGFYSKSGLPAGDYMITPLLNGYAFTPSYQRVTISTTSVSNVNFTGNPILPLITKLNPTTGSATTPVIIKGTGFGTTPGQVNFGSTAVTNISSSNWTNTRITVSAPVGTGSVAVTVTTAQGTSNTSAFTYLPPVRTTMLIPSGNFQVLISLSTDTPVITGTSLTQHIVIHNVAGRWYFVTPSASSGVTGTTFDPHGLGFLIGPQQTRGLGSITFPRGTHLRLTADDTLHLARLDLQTVSLLLARGLDIVWRMVTSHPLSGDAANDLVAESETVQDLTGSALDNLMRIPIFSLAIHLYRGDYIAAVNDVPGALCSAVSAWLPANGCDTVNAWSFYQLYINFLDTARFLIETNFFYPDTESLTFTAR